jgi:hypothetical protein
MVLPLFLLLILFLLLLQLLLPLLVQVTHHRLIAISYQLLAGRPCHLRLCFVHVYRYRSRLLLLLLLLVLQLQVLLLLLHACHKAALLVYIYGLHLLCLSCNHTSAACIRLMAAALASHPHLRQLLCANVGISTWRAVVLTASHLPQQLIPPTGSIMGSLINCWCWCCFWCWRC